MTPEMKAQLTKFVNSDKAFNTLNNLRNRWQAEKEYEDFSDYAEIIKTIVPEGWTFIKATKKPFGLQMASSGITIRAFLKLTATSIVLRVEVV